MGDEINLLLEIHWSFKKENFRSALVFIKNVAFEEFNKNVCNYVFVSKILTLLLLSVSLVFVSSTYPRQRSRCRFFALKSTQNFLYRHAQR